MGKSTVDLVEYSGDWPRMFEEAAAVLRAILGDRALLIEHIGSTSVPGLIAKPTIDIAVAVRDERAQHVHFREYPAAEFDDWILFRDLLRRDESARCAYADEKRDLAARFHDDRGSYVDAKTRIVERLLAQARHEGRRP